MHSRLCNIMYGLLLGDVVKSPMPDTHHLGLQQAGLDSLGAVELKNAIGSKFGIDLPATAAFDYPTASALADYIEVRMAPSQVSIAGHCQYPAIFMGSGNMGLLSVSSLITEAQVMLLVILLLFVGGPGLNEPPSWSDLDWAKHSS